MFRYISRVFARQVVRRIAVIAVGALFMLLPALWGGLQAHAASDYDEQLFKVNNLKISNTRSLDCEEIDISNDFISRVLDANSNTTGWQDDLESAIQSGGRWVVTQEIGMEVDVETQPINPTNEVLHSVIIYWTQDDTLAIGWNPVNDGVSGISVRDENGAIWPNLNSDGIRGVRLRASGGQGGTPCQMQADEIATSTIQGWNNGVSGVTGGGNNYLIANYNYISNVDNENINYPTGYEGPEVSQSAPVPPVTGENYAPDWRILTANNWRAEIRDYRFVTFDGIPWTCSEDGNSIQSGHEGLAPVIEWELYNENNTLIDDGILSATAHWNYQFPEHNTDTTYTIKGRYDCGGAVNFSVIGEKEFTITETGLLKEQDFFAQCVMLEPPFVDVPACIENVFRVIEIMAFNQITLVQGLNSTENCRQLVVLGHWINKPYEVVCPQFSQAVRNTITPFVTFILGLLTALIIVRFMNNRGLS